MPSQPSLQASRKIGAVMTSRDRAELRVAAVIGAVLGSVTYYVVGGGWIPILLCALIGAVIVSGAVYKLQAFR